MEVFIEGEIYPKDVLLDSFEDSKFYHLDSDSGKITSVGYCFSYERNNIIYVLPKVFQNVIYETLRTNKLELINYFDSSIKLKKEYLWFRKIIVFHFKSLQEYKKRFANSTLFSSVDKHSIDSNIGSEEYSFLELIFSFQDFYKRHKDFVLYEYKKNSSRNTSKVNWNKTLAKKLPLMGSNKKPIYEIYDNKKKVTSDEELIKIFFSILNSFNTDFDLGIKIDPSIEIYKSSRFTYLQGTGKRKLKKLKHTYFNDTLKRMYRLCLTYFQKVDNGKIKYAGQEYFSIMNYNIVFEDMLDKILSIECDGIDIENNGVSLNKLKKHDDGKIIDHFYNYQSLIEDKDVFYIGDSKYYKPENSASNLSKYKQFTYAKNILQFHIDLLNNERRNGNIVRYRDELTEGYEISPNFFIYGYIDNLENYSEALIEKKGSVHRTYHFKERVFDRDSLFVHQYKINFLYILETYTKKNKKLMKSTKEEIKHTFRKNFIEYFNDSEKCMFDFYYHKGELQEHSTLISKEFRQLYGKVCRTEGGVLIFAKHIEDNANYEIEKYLTKYYFQ